MAGDGVQVNDTPVPPITVHNKGPITNELLCYVACKIHTCTFDVIVKMCTDFYDGDVITVAKDDLMACVTLPEDDKRSGRRRANLKEVHMKDIVSILLEIKPEEVPVFLARDLNNVPPLSLNNFDMSRIILDMEKLKTQMKIIQEAQETALTAHVVLCRDANTGSTSTPARTAQPTVVSPIQQLVNTTTELNITTEDATINDAIDNNNSNISNPRDAAVTDEMRPTQPQEPIPELNPPTPEYQHARRDRRHHDVQRNVSPPPVPVVTDMSYAAAARRQPPPQYRNRTHRDNRMHHNDRRIHYADGSGRTATGLGRAADHGPRDGRGKNNGDYIVTGKGENFYLCAAQQVQRKKKERVGLFLSRVRPDFRCADIVRHVRHVTGLTVRCEPVPTRYDTYASYCIRASPNEIDRLMNGNLWPRGVIVKEYTKLI